MTKLGCHRLQGTSLGFLAGYVDTLGFLALFGLFTAHVTGNFILIGAALADPGSMPILLKFLAFPAFIAGVAAARVLIASCEQREARALRPAFVLELLLLALFMAAGMASVPGATGPDGWAMASGLIGAAAMGAHSATSRLLLGHLAPTSMMTGNVTQMVIDSVDYARGSRDAELDARLGKFAWPLLSFAAGCVIAAFGFHQYGFLALAVPLLILVALIAVGEPAEAS
ncbi:YoaK family protein [Massilia niabensis]|uniref:YoaK family protein n=1 Tax=Massilia niabensis TaxID=544910 RepID=A0ABW0L584_9BURK